MQGERNEVWWANFPKANETELQQFWNHQGM
jgi:hypothetical protein